MTNEQAKIILEAVQQYRDARKVFEDWLNNIPSNITYIDSEKEFDKLEGKVLCFAQKAIVEFCNATNQSDKAMHLYQGDIDWIEKNTIRLNKK